MSFFDRFKKKQYPVVKQEESEEQKAFKLHKEAVTNLQNLRNLWIYLLSKQTTREKKKLFKRDFIASDKFSEEVLDDTIAFYKKQSKSA